MTNGRIENPTSESSESLGPDLARATGAPTSGEPVDQGTTNTGLSDRTATGQIPGGLSESASHASSVGMTAYDLINSLSKFTWVPYVLLPTFIYVAAIYSGNLKSWTDFLIVTSAVVITFALAFVAKHFTAKS